MKIAIVTTMQHPCSHKTGWGAEKYIWDLIECLNNDGHKIMLFAKEGSKCPSIGELIICLTEDEVLYKYIKKLFEVDIVHDFSTTKIIHDYCQENNIKSVAMNFNVHYLYPKIHKNIVCISNSQKQLGLLGKSGFEGTPWEQMVGYTGQLKCDAKVIYLGINIDHYKPKYEKQDYILYFNSWDYRKGIHIAINLAKQMGFKLIIAGEVMGHPEHQQTFKELKPIIDLMPNIQYFTDVTNDEKIELMQNAKALLFPSLFHQPFAVVVLESLACGTPVITINNGSMPELIKHNETGFICNTITEMVNAIKNINQIDPKKCREDVIKRFDRIFMAKQYIKIYEDVINGAVW